MAIRLNGEPVPWHEGMTVASLIADQKMSFPLKNVVLNGKLIPRNQYAQTPLTDGDIVDIIHMISGG